MNVFDAARKVAQERGWAFNWRLIELPGVGHSASKMFAAPQGRRARAVKVREIETAELLQADGGEPAVATLIERVGGGATFDTVYAMPR